MNLNKNNLFARYYNWIYRHYPDDICSFFWGTVLIVVLCPFFIPGKLFFSTNDSLGDIIAKSVAFWVTLLVCMVFGLIPYGGSLKEWFMTLPNIVQITLLIVTGAVEIALVVCIGVGIYYIAEYRRESKRQRYLRLMEETNYQYEEPPTMGEKVGNFIGAIRGKYCTKITWK